MPSVVGKARSKHGGECRATGSRLAETACVKEGVEMRLDEKAGDPLVVPDSEFGSH